MRLSLLSLLLTATGAALPAQGRSWDIPQRGALVYRRSIEELRVEATGNIPGEVVLRRAEDGGHLWRYREFDGDPPAGWQDPSYDDSDWQEGKAMFGGGLGTDPLVRTRWTRKHLCLRTALDLGRRRPKAALFRLHHDDHAAVWCNGVEIVDAKGYGRDRYHAVLDDRLSAMRRGRNVLAVQGTNIGGALYLDVELILFWQLPRGVRTAEELIERVRKPRREADGLRRRLFVPFRSPPILLQGELDGAGQRLRMPPADLRDLGSYVALDLGRTRASRRLQFEVPRLQHFGDLLLEGRCTDPDAEGWQELRLAVTSELPAPRVDSKRFVERYLLPHCDHRIEGTMVVRRHLQTLPGGTRVTAFSAELEAGIGKGRNAPASDYRLHHRETWTLREVRGNRDAAFRKAVGEAIAKGCEFLRKAIAEPDKGDTNPGTGGNRSYGSGRLALALLALLKGNARTDDETVTRGLESLRHRELIDTYSLGLALMAMEAAYAPPNEAADLRAGILDRPQPRQPTPEDLERMRRWTEQLLANADSRDDPLERLRFGYVPGPSFDHSTNQYGLLGLYSAHLCGVRIDPRLWEAAIRHLVAAQCEPGRRLELDLVSYAEQARRRGEDRTGTAARSVFAPAGWTYKEPREGGMFAPAYGSMTCAGVAGLALCHAALSGSGYRADPKLRNEGTLARLAGMAWIAEHLQFRYHPGWMPRQRRWVYYYLYGLERAAVLSGVALIQDRDWYFEGAMVLTALQLEDGSWPAEAAADPALDRTAMAVLFLKQASLPVLTGR